MSFDLIVVLVSFVKNYTLTSKHRNIIVITTTEQYFSPLPEKYRYPSILILYPREKLTFCILKEYKQDNKCYRSFFKRSYVRILM